MSDAETSVTETIAPAATIVTAAPPAKRSRNRIESIHNLRGLASLAVLFDHLVATPYVAAPAAVAAIGILGNYGVTVFFFISGFVLPYSLQKSNYRIQDFPMFIARRFVRVDPPFFVVVGLTLLLNVLLGVVKNTPYHIDWLQVFAHVAYIAPLLHKPWLLSVFWTLCTEFQFYITIGLIFPILARYPIPIAIACAACMWLYVPGYFPTDRLPLGEREIIFAYLPSFMVGMATFLYREKLVKFPTFAVAIAISVVALFFKAPIDISIVALITIVVVIFASFYNVVLDYFGKISYSLYLIHLLVILGILPVFHRFGLPWYVMMVIGGGISIGAATLIYHFVEGPALAMSKRLRLKPRPTPPKRDSQAALELDAIPQVGKAN
ncbi:acyltransferase [Sphingomonas oligophenolica]|uniref:Acyltransferase n=1 Tax=Sphingomonas oligophenolica TaxID=301154 RepID=A0ABU9Y9I5_9SPHN